MSGGGGIEFSIVVAIAGNNVIGNQGGMPWRLSTDLKRFKQLTMGKPMIMGRKTFDAIGKALPGRSSIVVTRDDGWQAEGAVPVQSLETAMTLGREIARSMAVNEVCIVGGGDIYRQALQVVDTLHVTRVEAVPEGDTVFPVIDANVWNKISETPVPFGEKDSAATRYIIYKRR